LTEKFTATVYTARSLSENLDTTGATPQTQSIDEVSDYFGLNLDYTPSTAMKFSLGVGIGFTGRDGTVILANPETGAMESGEREDAYYAWNLNWEWKLRKDLLWNAGYKYSTKRSNFKNFEYSDHLVSGALKWIL